MVGHRQARKGGDGHRQDEVVGGGARELQHDDDGRQRETEAAGEEAHHAEDHLTGVKHLVELAPVR